VDDILPTLLYLIPVAFFIFIRMKGARNRQTRRQNESAPPRGTGPAVKPEKEIPLPDLFRRFMTGETSGPGGNFSPPEAEASDGDGEEDEVFDTAWRQFRPSPGTEEPPRAAPPPPKIFPAKPAPAAFVPPVKEQRFSPETQSSSAAGDAGQEVAWEPKSSPDLAARLAALSSLQRAIVMAEVLGKPKALKEEFDV
jgi:hypothetical protein